MDYYLLAGILFSAHAIITLMTSIEDYIHVFEYNPLLYSSYILIWIVELIFGILLMMKKDRQYIGYCLIALAFLRWFAYIEPYVCYHFFSIDALKGLFIPIAFTLLCLMHFEYIPSADIWFIPAILSTLNTIINMFAGSYLSVLSFITWIMFVGAMFMYGYICSGKTGQQGAALSVSPGSTVRTAQQTNNESRNIQELKAFFELYQDGVISEEEYMEKRKEILRR